MPRREMMEYLPDTSNLNTEIPSTHDWKKLMASSGLDIMSVSSYKYKPSLREFIGDVGQYSLRDYFRMLARLVDVYLKGSSIEKYLVEDFTSFPKGFLEHFGYGIYVGKKQDNIKLN